MPLPLLQRCLPVGLVLCCALAAPCAGSAEDLGAMAGRLARLEQQMAAAGQQLAGTELAQLFGRPPADIPGGGPRYDLQPAQDAPELDVRVDRLENQMRTLTGQIEQTQYALRRLEEELKKFEQDAALRGPDPNLRPSGRGLPQRRGEVPPVAPEYPTAASPEEAPATPGVVAGRHGDAFDPASDPTAPGAPRRLGTLPTGPMPEPGGLDARGTAEAAAGPLDADPNAPLDLSTAARRPVAGMPPAGRSAGPAADAPTATAALPGPSTIALAGGPSAAPGPGGGPREDYEAAIAYFRQGQYEAAQTGLEAFIKKYPKDRLVADAVFYLGESYSQRGRHREAAEQYLKVATDYAKSARAPEGLVKLGMSLNALGAKEQACATFGEVARKYPNASAAVKTSVDRELKRAKC